VIATEGRKHRIQNETKTLSDFVKRTGFLLNGANGYRVLKFPETALQ